MRLIQSFKATVCLTLVGIALVACGDEKDAAPPFASERLANHQYGCATVDCICREVYENGRSREVIECAPGFACTGEIPVPGYGTFWYCQENVTCEECAERHMACEAPGPDPCLGCLPGWRGVDCDASGCARCVAEPNCVDGRDNSISEACGERNRDCVEYGDGAVCGPCRDGFELPADAMGDEAVCVPSSTCDSLACEAEGRSCDAGADPTRCGACLTGWDEDEAGDCVQLSCGNTEDPDALAYACGVLNRGCEELEDGDGAICGGCRLGFSDDGREDGGLFPCRELDTCESLDCEGQGRACVGGEGVLDDMCGACLPGFASRAGECMPTSASCDPDAGDSILAACDEMDRICVPGEDGRTAVCGGCTEARIVECGARVCQAGRCEGCDAGQVEEDGQCRAPKTCEDITNGGADPCPDGCLALDEEFGVDARCARCESQVGSDRPESIWVPGLTQCVACPSCDGPGADGPWPEPSSAGWCICETLEGFFFSTAGEVGPLPCDADGDGWVRESARRAIESDDHALRTNARCSLRFIEAITYVNERGEELTEPVEPPVPMYESDRNDDDGILEVLWARAALPQQLLSPGAIDAKALNRFTRVCAHDRADFNDNGVPDVGEGQGMPPSPGFREDQHIFNQNSYFLELYTGVWRPTSGNVGEWVISERSRARGGDIQIGYPFESLEPGSPDSPEFWRTCERRTDASYVPGDFAVNQDFAGVTDDPRGFLNHHAQFKCVDVGRGVEANDDRYAFNICEIDGGEDLDRNARLPGFDCRVDTGDPVGVRWAAVNYQDYAADPTHAGYTFGCINECAAYNAGDADPTALARLGDRACTARADDGAQTRCTQGSFGQLRCQELPCDNADNDGDGDADEGFLQALESCDPDRPEVTCCSGTEVTCCETGFAGECARGSLACDPDGAPVCVPNVEPGREPESCNGLDDDCDGIIDEDPAWPVGSRCLPTSGQPTEGECADRVVACIEGELACVGASGDGQPRLEICDGVDNDCDGDIDEGLSGRPIDPEAGMDIAGVEAAIERFGQACVPDNPQSGPCASAAWSCVDGAPRCTSVGEPMEDGCADGNCAPCPATLDVQDVIRNPRWAHCRCDGIDNDCDSVIDEDGACERVGNLNTRINIRRNDWMRSLDVHMSLFPAGDFTYELSGEGTTRGEAELTYYSATSRSSFSSPMGRILGFDVDPTQFSDFFDDAPGFYFGTSAPGQLSMKADVRNGDREDVGDLDCTVTSRDLMYCSVRLQLSFDIAPTPLICDGIGAAELCDGRDNDCDGITDEEPSHPLLPDPNDRFDGQQACVDANTPLLAGEAEHEDLRCRTYFKCSGGRIICTTNYPDDPRPIAEICDNRDNDCDGIVDEGYFPCANPTACGDGLQRCVAGQLVGQCEVPCESECGAGWARCEREEDGIRDVLTFGPRCWAGKDSNVPLGVCSEDGGALCAELDDGSFDWVDRTAADNARWRGAPLTAADVVPYGETETCGDGLDNDCDGRLDEGFDIDGCRVFYEPAVENRVVQPWGGPESESACLCNPTGDFPEDQILFVRRRPNEANVLGYCAREGLGRLITFDEYRERFSNGRRPSLRRGDGRIAVDEYGDCPDGQVATIDPQNLGLVGCGNGRAADQVICVSECGDGVLASAAGEECDDGNRTSGDGCDVNCMIDGEPPVLEDALAYLSEDRTRVGIWVRGTDREADARMVRVTLRDEADLVVPIDVGLAPEQLPRIQFEGPLSNLRWTGRSFEGGVSVVRVGVGDRVPVKADIEIIDSVGLTSQTVERALAPPPEVGLGQVCDPAGALDACVADSVCFESFGTASCRPSRAPVIDPDIRAVVDSGRGTLSMEVSGNDPDGDAAHLVFQVLLDGGVLGELVEARDVMVNAENGDFWTRVSWRIPADLDASAITSVRLRVEDELGSRSPMVGIIIDTPDVGVVLAEGDECIPGAPFGACAVGDVCDLAHEAGRPAPGPGFQATGGCRPVIPVSLCAAGLWLDEESRYAALELVYTNGELALEDSARLHPISAQGDIRPESYSRRVEPIEALDGLRPIADFVPGQASWDAPDAECVGAGTLRRGVVFFQLRPEDVQTRVGMSVQLVDLGGQSAPAEPARVYFDRRGAGDTPRVLMDGDACFSGAANSIFGLCEAPPLLCAQEEEGAQTRCRLAADPAHNECTGPSDNTQFGRRWALNKTLRGSCGNSGVPYVWEFTVPAGMAGNYAIAASGGRDPVLHVHWACEAQSDTEIACDDDSGGNLTSVVIVPLEEGQTVYAYTHEYRGGSAEDIELDIWMIGN
jgi:hypothetical protein